jgi:AraC-like DNA-binding protein
MIALMAGTLESLRFNIPEILSLIGLVQCVYILVYMAFRAGGWKRAFLPFVYFLVLGLAFFAGFASRFIGAMPFYALIDWALWFMGPPLSVLLVIQIARITEPPSLRHFRVLGVLPLALVLAIAITRRIEGMIFQEWLTLTGILAGVVSLLAMWGQRPVLAQLTAQPGGRDRYWLILTLVIVNLGFLATMLLSLTPVLSAEQAMVIRSIWGLGFVYVAGTSLFRIYPQAVRLVDRAPRPGGLSEDEHKIAQRIENLLTLEKVYHEPAYNRVSLAKELGISETVVSRVINQHFGRTLPQLFNEYRIQDAKRLLQETDAPVKTICEEVGFNSIASFNRVFRDMEGATPGQYRELHQVNLSAKNTL